MDWRARSAAVVASAALFYFGTGFTPVPGLAALAPLPILWLAPRTSARLTALLSWLTFALGTTNSWALYKDSVDVPIPLAVVIVVGTSATFMAATLLFRALILRGHGLLATLAAPAAHVSGWYLASVLSPAGIMGTLATGQADVPVVLQIASLTGAWGVDYLVMLVPAAAAALLSPGVRRVRTAAAAGLAVAATLAFGAVRLATAPDPGPLQVALIGGSEKFQWGIDVTTEKGRGKIAAYTREIRRLDAEVIVLPEGAFAATRETLPQLTEPLREAAAEQNSTVVVGVVIDGRRNTALAISAKGRPVEYTKWHDRGPHLEPGTTLEYVPNTTTALTVCGDVNFANPVRAYAAKTTDLLAIPASDEDLNGWQHSRTALLRGVENGVGIAWAAQRGTVLAADAWGRTITSAQTISPIVTATAQLPVGAGPTLYTRLGDWFAWLCLTLMATGLIAAIRKKAM
jgi:apolipoprotein N-acyltransferase